MNAADVSEIERLNDLAKELYERGKYREAISAGRRARDQAARCVDGSHPLYTAIVNNLGSAYFAAGEYRSAETLLGEALDIERSRAPESRGFVRALVNLGVCQDSMGKHTVAISSLSKAVEILRGESSRWGLGPLYVKALSGLAGVHESLKDIKAAESLYKEAIRVVRESLGTRNIEYAIHVHNFATLCATAEKYYLAERLYNQALDILREVVGEGHPAFINTLSCLAEMCRLTGAYDRAELLFAQVSDSQQDAVGANHPKFAQMLNNRALLRKWSGDFTGAESLFRQALEVWRKSVGECHPDYVAGLNNLAATYAAIGRIDQAYGMMERASRLDDNLLTQILHVPSESQRLEYATSFQGNMSAYLTLVSRHLSTSPEAVRSAFELVLRRKQITSEVMAARQDDVLQIKYPELGLKIRELSELRRRIASLTVAGQVQAHAGTSRPSVAELNQQAVQKELALAKVIPELALRRRLTDVTAEAVARHLPEDAALIEFARFDMFDFAACPARDTSVRRKARYLAFVLLSSDPTNVIMVDLGEARAIDRMVCDLRTEVLSRHGSATNRDMVRTSGDAKRVASDGGKALSAVVLDKLTPALRSHERLLISPDGELCQLPFEILPIGTHRYLIDDYTITYLGCGRDVLPAGNWTGTVPSAPIVLADPDFNLAASSTPSQQPKEASWTNPSWTLRGSELEFPRLMESRAEGTTIAEMLGVRPWLFEEALKGRLRKVRSPSIIHLATHGFFLAEEERDQSHRSGWVASDEMGRLSGVRLENPLLRNGLALAGANTWLNRRAVPREAEDGLLTAADVATMDLANTQLVVLSACETGRGEIHCGEGVFGLRRSFALAGARSLVMSLWKVPDAETRELMVDFYRNIFAGELVAEALRRAKLAMKAKYEHPFYWGAFIYQGQSVELSLGHEAAVLNTGIP